MTPRSTKGWLTAAALVLVAIFAASCSGSASTEPAAEAPASPTPASEVAGAVATPEMLPVTPININYEIVDPAFAALPGAQAIFGEYEGAGYQIEVPDAWNGEVVYYAHGFRGNPPALTVSFPPLRDYLIANGYAWAASSYSRNGYEPGAAARDTYALRDVFVEKVGAPSKSYIYGQSMGGHVVALSLEQYPTAYDGALSECGVVAGHEVLDYFLSWGALSAYFAGVDLHGLTSDAQEFGSTISGRIAPALGTLEEPTAAGKAFADVIQNLTGGERPFFREGYAGNYAFNFAILVNAVGNAGPSNAAAQNVSTVYAIDDGFGVTSEQLNREVSRISANVTYRDASRYPEFADMTGRIERPHLTLHGTGDLFVPISLEASYRKIVDAAGRGDLLVQRAVRRAGHCAFSDAERIRGFEDLVNWVETGDKPAGEDLTGDLRDAGRAFTDPFEPNDPGGLAP
jgi:pimeloyl-ACP methyl ester carboxylesterase